MIPDHPSFGRVQISLDTGWLKNNVQNIYIYIIYINIYIVSYALKMGVALFYHVNVALMRGTPCGLRQRTRYFGFHSC